MIATITKIEKYNDHDVIFSFDCAEIAQKALPGQFVEVRVSKTNDPFRRRPFSVFDTCGDVIKLLVRVVGRGTKIMSGWNAGDSTDILGPLGNSFSIDEQGSELILVSGGSGLAPINFLVQKLAHTDRKVHLLYLYSQAREAELAAHLAPSERLSVTLSHDKTGATIAPLLQEIISNAKGASMIYTCGPESMMKIVVETSAANNIPVKLSMEAAMGCGIGICSCCVVPVRSKDGFTYKKACADGPIFSGEEIVFNE